MKSLFLLLTVVLTVLGLSGGEVNLARGCSYIMNPIPRYPACSGPEDATDLTDGRFTEKKPMALDRGAVGWRVGKSPEVNITIDLGAVKKFNRVTFSTGGGSNSISYPSFINVEVSGNGSDFYQLGCLTALSKNPWPPVDAGYRNLVFDADFQAVEARYVRLRCIISGLFMFCDEIEVFASGEVEAARPESLPPALESAELLKSLPGLITENCVRRSYNTLLAKIGREIPKDSRIGVLEKRISQWKLSGEVKDFTAVYPIDELHRDIFRLHAEKLKQQGRAGLAVWNTRVYDLLDVLAEPSGESTEVRIKMAMMNRERRLAAVNLRNYELQPLEITAVLQGVPGRIYRVEVLDSNNLQPISTSLVPAENKIILYPGLAAQLVIEFAPDNLDAGLNRGSLVLHSDVSSHEIPIDLTVSPQLFPNSPTLSSGMWDYLDFATKPVPGKLIRRPADVLRDIQKEHQIRVAFANHTLAPACHPLRHLEDETLDFSGFDRWVQSWPDAEKYVIYLSIKSNSEANGKKPGSPEFTAAVRKWAERWERHLESLGLAEGRVVFQMLDEPRDEDAYRNFLHWRQAVKAGSRRVALFNNPLAYKPEFAQYLEATDILCPVGSLLINPDRETENDFRRFSRAPHQLWVYRCSAGPFNIDPGYYRNQAYLAFRHGATGSMFWALGDIGRGDNNSRNQYLTRPIYYSPLMFAGSRVEPTKHLKAIRDGVQDYEYLVMLKQLASGTAREATAERLIKDALAELTTSEALNSPPRTSHSPAETAEKHRLKILEMINSLSARK